ncbi:hypothetical protein OC188_00585 [Anaplasma capra]|uniref:hypothetical protein n=1 Tax=Anaplasma capra TaxID=1562740 RepID=UPI0021D5B032|nr:hypothetical protein [Anaplasma capra]MCU7611206.1 hypothetical protein [Anaplasma capra]
MQESSSADRAAVSTCVVSALVCVSVACLAAVVIKVSETKSGDWPLETSLARFMVCAALTVIALLFFALQTLERAWYAASITADRYRSFAAVIAWWLLLEGNKAKEALTERDRAVPANFNGYDGRKGSRKPDGRAYKGNERRRVGSMLWLLDVTDSIMHQRALCKNSILS